MKFTTWIFVVITLMAALVIPVAAEVVYTPVYVSIPTGGHYDIDLNQDGVIDFSLEESLIQDYCQFGDGYIWSLGVVAHPGNAVAGTNGYYAAALPIGQPVNSGQGFYPNVVLMADLAWGHCGTGTMGEWLNVPDRYLGLRFQGSSTSDIHYGWAKVTTSAYVDQHGVLHTSTILTGFAYETVPGKGILTGQTSDNPEPLAGGPR